MSIHRNSLSLYRYIYIYIYIYILCASSLDPKLVPFGNTFEKINNHALAYHLNHSRPFESMCLVCIDRCRNRARGSHNTIMTIIIVILIILEQYSKL